VRQGTGRRPRLVIQPRRWRWSPSRESGWCYPRWSHEVLEDGDARWFARIALTGETASPPVVLVHGVVVSGAYFQPVAEHLDGHLPLYVPDLPGTGRSHTRHGIWGIDRLAGALAGWLDLHQVSDAILVSNSVGCQVLTALAVDRPDLARALVLVSPTTDPQVSSVPGVMWRGLMDIPREDPSLWRVWLTDLVRTGPLRGLRLLRLAMRDPQLARLDRLRMPVIVVGGERDPIAPTRWIREMTAHLPCGRAVIVPNAPHALNYTNPRHLARIIRAAAGDWPDDDIEPPTSGPH